MSAGSSMPFRDPPSLIVRTPPLGRPVSPLSRLRPNWSDFSGIRSNPQQDPATQEILKRRIGGTFWERPVGRVPPVLLCVPAHPALALRMWQAAKDWADVSQLTLVTPAKGNLWRRMRQATRHEGAQALTSAVNPFSLLDSAQTILAPPDGLTDLAALGALAGFPVRRLNAMGEWETDPKAGDWSLDLLHNGTMYQSPFSGASIDLMEALALLANWQSVLTENRKISVCLGMSFWKRQRIEEFFATADQRRPHPLFRRTTQGALNVIRKTKYKTGVAVWATRLPRGLEQATRRENIPLLRIEDGFIRSAGLGSGFLPPASIITDQRGPYYDPAQPSDLEVLLSTHPLGAALQERARKLITVILERSISKYAAGGASPDLGAPLGCRIILVPGQVEDDMSVRLGGGSIQDNMTLLRRVRAACPEAFIIYRPHPDVHAGHRTGALRDADVLKFADRICREGGMAPLLDVVDEVHTLTSLTGFEALMRGLSVTTYGQPFYAGWGLTNDHAPVARRTRRLNMAQLAAATLLLYPRYIDPVTRLPCGPEVLVDRFGTPDLWRPGPLMRLRHAQGRIRRAFVQGVHAVFHKRAENQKSL
ncbi:capsular polysaccharide export protein, LipB/KpsS family [Gluconobacter wancherniae]|uniref:capsular polysaccharide export protein, LipB/KpsS family n=1 Tax=Gluconobacter wancherniae TaxID=1307955 RepID=UPI00201219EE|nr:capsular biosynthesis protein [Gluconobacter wancherniae]